MGHGKGAPAPVLSQVDLQEKRDTKRYQLITRALHDWLLDPAHNRGSALITEPVFRYHPDSHGKVRLMRAKRFETLWMRISNELPSAKEKGVNSHLFVMQPALGFIEHSTPLRRKPLHVILW